MESLSGEMRILHNMWNRRPRETKNFLQHVESSPPELNFLLKNNNSQIKSRGELFFPNVNHIHLKLQFKD